VHLRPLRATPRSGARAASATVGAFGAFAALAAFACLATFSRGALAAGPGGGSGGSSSGEPNTAPPPESVLDPESGKVRPAAPDERGGHIYLAASVGAVGPTGSVGTNTPTSSVAGVGYALGGILGLGIGRYGTVQLFGDATNFGSPENCSIGCSGRSFSLGLGVTYHLAQGLAIDPWTSFGMAYRGSTFFISAPGTVASQGCVAGHICSQSYQGFDVARIALGGDFYPTSWFGFGPFLETDIGTNLHRPAPLVTLPPDVVEGPRAYAFFQVGVRIALDPMRRPHPAAPRAAASASPDSSPPDRGM
jgi:hypothetical protein